jgi:beta-galactosidase
MVFESSLSSQRELFSLNGQWTFALDPGDSGERDKWYAQDLADVIRVPGSWEEQGFGDEPASRLLWGWNKLHEYEGAAWYSRMVEIPAEWDSRSVELVLRGVRWRSTVWVDGARAGEQESLSTPQRFDLTAFLKPGSTHRLAIRVDNRMLYDLPESHINSDQTATHWGGITGGAALETRPATAIQRVTYRPDVAARRFDFKAEITGSGADLTFEVTITNPESGETVTGQTTVSADRAALAVELGPEARLWWDDDPFLYQAEFVLRQGDTVLDALRQRLGLREITTDGRQLLLNGRPVFLRGYVDCCIFPQTAYPVWDLEEYRHQFRIARSYGFNHVRLHSWTPPEPFWQAADELGMLVQTELPHWSRFYDHAEIEPPEDVHGFLARELELIVREYHFHPSWVLFSNGNELIGNSDGHPRLTELIRRGRELDPTRLYTDQTGFGRIPAPSRHDADFYVQSCNWHPPKKIYDAASNDTTEDFSAVIAHTDRPLIGHEHGQFTMYVRPSEAEKYTGVLRPSWLESVLETLEAKGMTARLDAYIQASGRHIARTYKENIERARRTRGLAGLQLLDIRDFPGQGHATTGLLDMFWDSKGLVEPETFAQVNSAVVLLMRAPSPTFWNGEALTVDLEVSNFGHDMIAGEPLRWELRDRQSGETLTGEVGVGPAPVGTVTPLCRLEVPLPAAESAHAWELRVELGGAENSWHFWSFPYPQLSDDNRGTGSRLPELRNRLPGGEFSDNYGGLAMLLGRTIETLTPDLRLAISDRLSIRLLQYLCDGGCVWLMPSAEQLHTSAHTRYLPPFWSHLHFPDNVSSVMGMIIPTHPALGRFPHDGFSDWQWYNLVNDTPAICLDSIPFVEPVVKVVDNFNRAKRLCYAFETQVGRGRLFVSTWHFADPAVSGRPEAGFLFHEIVHYLRSDAFAPASKVSVGQLLGVFKLTNSLRVDFE